MRLPLCIAVLLLLLVGGLAHASSSEDAERALMRLQTLTASVSSLRCAFTQRTLTPLFTAPVESTGTLLFRRPDSLAWEYDAPVPQGLVLSGGKGFRWEDDRRRRVPFAAASDPMAALVAEQMLSWIRFDRQWIERQYAIRLEEGLEEGEGLAFTLTPKRPELAAVIRSLSIRFAADGVARVVILREASGGQTEIRLRDVVVNGPISEREFQ
jgi:outer membrane lipoprotein carrier protein